MTEEIKQRLINEYSDRFDFLDSDIDSLTTKSDIHIRHKECGTDYTTKLYIFLRESSRKYGCCPKCRRKKKMTNDEFLDKVTRTFGDEWNIISPYTGYNNKIMVRHNKCNSPEYLIGADELLKKTRSAKCKYCVNRLSIQDLNLKLGDHPDGSNYMIIEDQEYTDNKTPIKIMHKTCGCIFESPVVQFFPTGLNKRYGRCKYCYDRSVDTDKFKNRVRELTGDEYSVKSDYKKSDEKILMRHNKCGNEYFVKPVNFTSMGNRCPLCTPIRYNRSYKELELSEFISNDLNIPVVNNKRFYTCGKSFKEADILLEDKNIIIEFNGLYWHTETESSHKNIYNKTTFFEDLGYRVIHIFEDDWEYSKETVKRKIGEILKPKTYSSIKTIKNNNTITLVGDDENCGSVKFEISKNTLNITDSDVVSAEIYQQFINYVREEYEHINCIHITVDRSWFKLDDNIFKELGFKLVNVIDPALSYINRHIIKRFNTTDVEDTSNYHELYDAGYLEYILEF